MAISTVAVAPTVFDVLRRYWFRPGGVYAIAICRIALFIAVFYAYEHGASAIIHASSIPEYYSTHPAEAYNPKGPLRLLFYGSPPSVDVVTSVIVLAKWATLFAIFGLLTRPSMIVSVLSVTFLISLYSSWQPYWSHGYNVILLAGLAFMFGRAGDVLSVDALVRRYLWHARSSLVRHEGCYSWPVLLAQAAVALFYFGGFYAKWSGPDWTFTLDWVFSDNLRNSLAFPWNQRGLEMPWYIVLVTSHPFLWKLVAMGHMIHQVIPISACFSVSRPYLRLVEGLIFGFGVLTLGWFMTLWNLHWLLLTVFFVDWDFFLERLGILSSQAGRPRRVTYIHRPSPDPAVRYITAFLGFYIATVFLKLGAVHLIYPFSSMPFYSNVKALPPYDQHRHYPFFGGQASVIKGGVEHELAVSTHISGHFRFALEGTSLDGRASAMRAVASALRTKPLREFGTKRLLTREGITEYRLYASVFHIPKYPSPASWIVAHRGLVGVYDGGDKVAKVVRGEFKRDNNGQRYIAISSEGLEHPQISVMFRPNPRTHEATVPLREMLGRWKKTPDETRFYIDERSPNSVFTVLRVQEDRKSYDFYGPEFIQ